MTALWPLYKIHEYLLFPPPSFLPHLTMFDDCATSAFVFHSKNKWQFRRLDSDRVNAISANSTHENLAVRKIMEAMRTGYARKRDSVSTRLKQNTTQTIAEHTRVCESKKRIVCEETFNSLNGLVIHSFLFFFSLVRISEFLYANFLTAYASPQKLARPLFVFEICRLLFPTLLDFICFILLDCPSFASSGDFLSFRPFACGHLILLFLARSKKRNMSSVWLSAPTLQRLAFCVAHFWWRALLSFRLSLGLLLIHQAVSIDCVQLILLFPIAVKQ